LELTFVVGRVVPCGLRVVAVWRFKSCMLCRKIGHLNSLSLISKEEGGDKKPPAQGFIVFALSSLFVLRTVFSVFSLSNPFSLPVPSVTLKQENIKYDLTKWMTGSSVSLPSHFLTYSSLRYSKPTLFQNNLHFSLASRARSVGSFQFVILSKQGSLMDTETLLETYQGAPRF
jgi:hypothetical protein